MNEPADGDKCLQFRRCNTNDFDPVTITIPAITSGKSMLSVRMTPLQWICPARSGLISVNADFDGSYIVEGVLQHAVACS